MFKIKINTQTWRVGLFSPLEEDAPDTCGYTSYTYNSIAINELLTPESMLSTVIHEVTHAYRWSYGFVNDIESQSITIAQLEEMVANFMEHYAADILMTSQKVYEKLEKERNGGSTKKS